MSWIWYILLVLAVGIVAAAEWPMVSGTVGAEGRRKRARAKRKAGLKIVAPTEDDDFVKSVQRDLDALPTTEEPRSKR